MGSFGVAVLRTSQHGHAILIHTANFYSSGPGTGLQFHSDRPVDRDMNVAGFFRDAGLQKKHGRYWNQTHDEKAIIIINIL